MKLFIKYHGTDKQGNMCVPYKAIVSSFDEAVNTIETWHTYGKNVRPTLIANDYCKQKLTEVFAGRIELPISISITNCGCYVVTIEKGLADNVAQHEELADQERLYQAQIAAKKRETEKYFKFKVYNKVAKGWYFVSIPLTLHDYECRTSYKTFTTYVLANSKIDAINKTTPEAEKYALNNGGFTLAKPISWEECDVYFVGMKTDDGFSLDAWKEKYGNKGTDNCQTE